ncbi:hypothetical protein L6164_013977 [Bauhinia variegata]|uniref:Uncharacterized protein n=1 Tax=Bauhinia variegata TaxID=167791 RepID=A0ACB9NH44_BAUVA|nr:hypothetical protein L6164_013977 [Bauhinia variegata]
MAASPKRKNLYTATTLVFLLLFLLCMFVVSRRNLEPALSLYRDLFVQASTFSSFPSSSNNTHIALPDHVSVNDPTADPEIEPVNLSTNQFKPIDPKSSTVSITDNEISSNDQSNPISNQEFTATIDDDGRDPAPGKQLECDLYMGTWVKDDKNYPIYKPGSCPYVDEAYDCQSNGRVDSEYTKWRWKPDGCDLPRYTDQVFLDFSF